MGRRSCMSSGQRYPPKKTATAWACLGGFQVNLSEESRQITLTTCELRDSGFGAVNDCLRRARAMLEVMVNAIYKVKIQSNTD
eukprot:7490353-Pyramimonas_sp.AAC.1